MKKTPKSKTSEAKKSQGNVIAVILIILLCLITIVILWRVILPMTQSTKEETQIRQELIKTRMTVNEVSGDISVPIGNKIDISLSRGSGEMELENQSTVEYKSTTLSYSSNISVVSVMDISNSMNDSYLGECKIDKTNACCTTNNCETETGCSNCGGRYLGNECYLYSLDPCCKDKDCLQYKSDCEFLCGGLWYPDPRYPYVFYCSINSCFENKILCENSCMGKWRSKLNISQEANNIFINNIFKNPDNEMSVVGFGQYVRPSDCEPSGCQSLTNDKNALKNKVNSYTTYIGTNACQGLNKSIEMLKSSPNNNIKVIVLMSDGVVNAYCNGTSGDESSWFIQTKQETVNQAVRANNSNITIYTIGFGEGADKETLERVANATNGTYSYSDISGLSVVYDNILQIINTKIEEEKLTFYEAVQKIDILRFVISNDTSTYTYDMPKDTEILLPLETKTYTIETGPITNINKIEVYIVVRTENGKEISELIATWTPDSEENYDYLPSY